MTISKDLMLAILSMDSYNRGYGAGLADPSAVGGGLGVTGGGKTYKVGAATITGDADDPDGLAQAAGFYAVSYTIGAGVDDLASGSTVISYRGTDNIYGEGDGGLDIWEGWTLGAGDIGDSIWKTLVDLFAPRQWGLVV